MLFALIVKSFEILKTYSLIIIFELINLTLLEIMKGRTALLAAVIFALDPVGLPASAPCAKNLAILLSELTEALL
jgi:hypothetical protein